MPCDIPRAATAALRVAVAVMCTLGLVCGAARAEPPAALFITLGTGGGPVVQAEQGQPANAVLAGDALYLFDVGDGTLRQLARAGLNVRSVQAVFVSHFHVDHVAGLGPLVIDRFVTGASAPMPIYGPPGMRSMLEGLAAAYAPVAEASPSVGPGLPATIDPHDLAARLTAPTLIYEDANVRVFAISVEHYRRAPGLPEYSGSPHAYAFRIDTATRSFVFTGDSGPDPNLAALARDADVLVSEVVAIDAISAWLRTLPGVDESHARALVDGMRLNHMMPEEIGQLAAEARVGSVVLTHQVPGPAQVAGPEAYTKGISQACGCPVSVATDLARF